MIHVIAVINAKPGQRESLLAQFRANIPAVRAETTTDPGCRWASA